MHAICPTGHSRGTGRVSPFKTQEDLAIVPLLASNHFSTIGSKALPHGSHLLSLAAPSPTVSSDYPTLLGRIDCIGPTQYPEQTHHF